MKEYEVHENDIEINNVNENEASSVQAAEPTEQLTADERQALADREAFEESMRAEDRAKGLPVRLRYADLSGVVWGEPVPPKKENLSQEEQKRRQKALAKAAREAAKRGLPPPTSQAKDDSYGLFMNYKQKFATMRVRFTSKRRVPFNPSNHYEAAWLNPNLDAKVSISLNDDPSEHPDVPEEDADQFIKALRQQQDEELAKLRYIQESAVDYMTQHSQLIFGRRMTRDEIVKCMCPLIGGSEKYPNFHWLSMKCYAPNPDPKKPSTQIVNITGVDHSGDGPPKVQWQEGNVCTVPMHSYLIPDVTIASSLWYRTGKGESWGFNSQLHRTPCYPKVKRVKKDAIKHTAQEAAMLVLEATGLDAASLVENEEPVQVKQVGDDSDDEETENGESVVDYDNQSTSSTKRNRSNVDAVDAALAATTAVKRAHYENHDN